MLLYGLHISRAMSYRNHIEKQHMYLDFFQSNLTFGANIFLNRSLTYVLRIKYNNTQHFIKSYIIFQSSKYADFRKGVIFILVNCYLGHES